MQVSSLQQKGLSKSNSIRSTFSSKKVQTVPGSHVPLASAVHRDASNHFTKSFSWRLLGGTSDTEGIHFSKNSMESLLLVIGGGRGGSWRKE